MIARMSDEEFEEAARYLATGIRPNAVNVHHMTAEARRARESEAAALDALEALVEAIHNGARASLVECNAIAVLQKAGRR